eukprot:14733330-Heterocapsa_arctica.AAC.1
MRGVQASCRATSLSRRARSWRIVPAVLRRSSRCFSWLRSDPGPHDLLRYRPGSVKQNVRALHDVSDELQFDKEFVMEAVTQMVVRFTALPMNCSATRSSSWRLSRRMVVRFTALPMNCSVTG